MGAGCRQRPSFESIELPWMFEGSRVLLTDEDLKLFAPGFRFPNRDKGDNLLRG